FQIAKGELIEKTFDFDLFTFCDKYGLNQVKTATALQVLQTNAIVEINNINNQRSSLQFLVSSHRLNIQLNSSALQHRSLVKNILRIYGGIFEQTVKIDEFYIAKKIGITSWSVVDQLEKLNKQEIVLYKKSSNRAVLNFLCPREDDRSINRISKNIEAFFNQKRQKLKQVLYFVNNKSVCRTKLLLRYFDQQIKKDCEVCDLCQTKKNANKLNVSELILNLLEQKGELSVKELCNLIDENDQNILANLRKLLAVKSIDLSLYNKYFIKK
ncbi:MAG: RecQ family zinc-binding domain-containing protein, partial [Tenacibaculum sp.]